MLEKFFGVASDDFGRIGADVMDDEIRFGNGE